MTGDLTTEKPTVTLTMGCDPQILVTLTENFDGSLFISLTDADGNDLHDIDGFFFNLNDDSDLDAVNFYPDENGGNEWSPVTDIQVDTNNVDGLSNGSQLMETYDAGVQFGTVTDSTQGTVTQANFTLWSDNGPIRIEDLDLENMAVVVDSDTDNGMVLTVNDDDETTDDDNEPDTDECAFTIEGEVNTEVVLTQLADGSIRVDLEVLSGDDPDATGEIGDIRGLFFNVEDESLLDDITVSGADVTGSEFDANSVIDLGNGTNMNGGQSDGYDGGVEIGTQGAADDDIQSTSFILSHPDGLSLDDFEGQEFGLRLTSVGEEGDEDREGSLKLTGVCSDHPPEPPVCEDQYSLENAMSLLTSSFAEDPAVPQEEELQDEMGEI